MAWVKSRECDARGKAEGGRGKNQEPELVVAVTHTLSGHHSCQAIIFGHSPQKNLVVEIGHHFWYTKDTCKCVHYSSRTLVCWIPHSALVTPH